MMTCAATAAPQFPTLTGRVVDQAALLSPQTEARLSQQLEDYERGTGNQFVVVTLPSLQGHAIEDYGYQLGRHWQIGQKDKNNGVLLIVAPNERKVRIEVGYGLEGQLTDAISSMIVQEMILPQFRNQNFEAGIVVGADAILSVLGGKGIPENSMQNDPLTWPEVIFIILFIALILFMHTRGGGGFGGPMIGGGTGGRRFGRSGSSSGFRGGGGRFGGGGSSGGWSQNSLTQIPHPCPSPLFRDTICGSI